MWCGLYQKVLAPIRDCHPDAPLRSLVSRLTIRFLAWLPFIVLLNFDGWAWVLSNSFDNPLFPVSYPFGAAWVHPLCLAFVSAISGVSPPRRARWYHLVWAPESCRRFLSFLPPSFSSSKSADVGTYIMNSLNRYITLIKLKCKYVKLITIH